jgi:predicted nuclease of restriction endonuclease-like (RecB) superfamily
MPELDLLLPADYPDWLTHLKQRIAGAQQRAALAVNTELVLLYWEIGQAILDKQHGAGWGGKVVERIAHDLRTAFPTMKGSSRSNLLYMRALADAWRDRAIVQQLVGQLPWGHNIVLLTKLKDPVAREWYARAAGAARSSICKSRPACTSAKAGR